MKVLHVIPGIAWRYGGTTATIRSLCAELASLPDVEVELATTDADGPSGHVTTGDIPGEYPVHIFSRTATEQWKYSRDLGVWLKSNTHRFDVVHIHALWSYASQAAARAAVRANVPYIIRPAGMLSRYTFSHGAWKKWLYWRWIEQRTVARAAAFHATSSTERDEIHRCRPNAVVHVIPNGVSNDAWQVERIPKADCRCLDDFAKGRLIVLFLSRLHPKKGIVDILLPAWKQIKTDAMLVIAGAADAHDPEHANQVRREIDRLRLTNVRLLGAIAANDRWELYDAAGTFVLPSHSENFGVVVAEAMARGCSVVVTDQVQACEHVAIANGGRVIPPDANALVEALESIFADPQATEECGRRGQAYARQYFAWPQIAPRIREMYSATMQLAAHSVN